MNTAKVTVIGSLNMDMMIEVDKQPAKGETVIGNKISYAAGGKGANQALASKRLGAEVSIIGNVGSDEFGSISIKELQKNGVDTNSINRKQDVATGIASITITQEDNSIVVIPGANKEITPNDIDEHIGKIKKADVILLQLEIPIETVLYTAKIAKKLGKTVVLNPAPAATLPNEIFQYIDIITPNKTELEFYTKMKLSNNNLKRLINEVKKLGDLDVVVTLGSKGSAYIEKNSDNLIYIKGQKVSVVDTTGAGDCYNGALAVAIAEGKDMSDAIKFASVSSALSVRKLGAQEGMPFRKEVLNFQNNLKNSSYSHEK